MSEIKEIFDVTFIGGGPAGLYGAFYAGRKKLKTKIIDSQPELGGRLTALYPTKTIYDVAGYPEIVSKKLVGNLAESAQSSGAKVVLGEKVESIGGAGGDVLTLVTDKGMHYTLTAVVAAGVGAFVPRGLDSPGAKELQGKGIFYNLEDVGRFRGKKVIIVGAGDNAFEWAADLAGVAKSVLLVHRLNNYGSAEGLPARLAKGGVEMKFPYYELKALHGEEKVEAITFIDTLTGEEERREVEALLLNIGFVVNLHNFQEWGLEVGGNSIKVNRRMQTSIPGVYAAGDIVSYPGKLKLISTAAGEAATAVNDIVELLKQRRVEARREAAGLERALETTAGYYSGFEAVQMAMALVRNSVEFFRIAVLSTGDRELKKFFARLQRDGIDHLNLLKEKVLPVFSKGAYSMEDLDDTALAYLRDSVDPFVFGGHRLAGEAARHGIPSDLDAIYKGIRVHEDTVAFFERLAREPGMAKVSKTFEELAAGERKHLELLRDQQKRQMESGPAPRW
jgi:thioredoxin reductase/rubrerythrin